MAAQIPDKPDPPVTSASATTVMISWSEPSDNGSPITAFSVYIRKADLTTFAIDSINCDGSLAEIRNAKTCTIPITTLMASPFNFSWGASIYAKVVATNSFGNSLESELGNGAIIMTKPDAPINLAETVASRTPTSITFTWDDGANNGGDVIIDYRVSIAQETIVYTVIAVGLTSKTFTATGL